MTTSCAHLDQIHDAAPSGDGCVECLALGMQWMHLRRCAKCGHIGCCDSSPGRHATGHFHETSHPIIQSFEPGEDWFWCYVDELAFELNGRNGSPSHA
jgi:Zn-finger in ubiquitin-hydrolases and other protein